MKQDKVLITGGTGMVGSAFSSLLPDGIFVGTSDFDLRDVKQVEEMFRLHKPEYVIHLAAKVGGVKANTQYVADFYLDNCLINHNVINSAKNSSVKKVVSLLSTCIYPDASYIDYPLTENQLHLGPPHQSNFGYAYSKRMIDVMSRAYRKQYGSNFITAVPNNLYGENDNFNLENSHVIPALIRKIWEAKLKNKKYIECWGDGSPLREFTYSKDIAKILIFLLENYDEETPVNIGNTEEYSIGEIVHMICKILDYEGDILWKTDKPSGQLRKPSSNQKLLNLGWKKQNYTSLSIGLKKTCDWFKMNYPNIRGMN